MGKPTHIYLASARAVVIAVWMEVTSAAASLGMGTANTIPLSIAKAWLAAMSMSLGKHI